MRIRLLFSAIVNCVLCPQPATAQKTVIITAIDVGQGDSILIEFPPRMFGGRKRMLVARGLPRTTMSRRRNIC